MAISKRDFTIDALKAVGIFLVVLGHTTKTEELHGYIYSFHMPLFFIISGLLYHARKDIVKRLVRSLLVPYVGFAFLTFAYWALIETRVRPVMEGTSIGEQFTNIFYPMSGIVEPYLFNVVLWFLPCLFIVTIGYHYLRELSLRTAIGGGGDFIQSVDNRGWRYNGRCR